MDREFPLSFTLVSCEDCGKNHAAGLVCPKCGAQPEADPLVVNRVAALSPARAALDSDGVTNAEVKTFDLTEFERLGQWLDRFLEASSRLAGGEEVGESLRDLVHTLMDSKATLASTDHRRPLLLT